MTNLLAIRTCMGIISIKKGLQTMYSETVSLGSTIQVHDFRALKKGHRGGWTPSLCLGTKPIKRSCDAFRLSACRRASSASLAALADPGFSGPRLKTGVALRYVKSVTAENDSKYLAGIDMHELLSACHGRRTFISTR